MLAANIGAGSTVGVAGLAYRDGLSAWWWSGSAGLGSFALRLLVVGPRLGRSPRTMISTRPGTILEFRYGPTVRGVITAWSASACWHCSPRQLIAGATILNVLTGIPRWVGALIGGAIMTIYFTAGGLLGTAWVNTFQLIVMLVGLLRRAAGGDRLGRRL